jgi:rod shape-determining protein MreC
VLNTRTGARSVAYGDPGFNGGGLELRFMAANADVLAGDLLTTSGVDGVYPPGLPVAKVSKVERRADTAFARIYCTAVAAIGGARHVMVIAPVSAQIAARPEATLPAVTGKKPASRASGPKLEAAP